MAVIKSEYLLPNYDPEEVGMKGEKGDDGKTSYVHIAYSNSSDGGVDFSTTDPTNRAYTGYYTDFEMIDSTDHSKYEWQRTKGDSGKDGVAGKDGVGLQSTSITYASHTNASTPPATGWNTQVPSVPAGQFLWTKTVWNYTDNTSETGYSVARMGQDGNNGKNGIAGKDGVGIKTTVIEYAISTSGTVRPTTNWSTTIPNTPAGQYLWTRTTWTYTDNTTEQGFTVARQGEKGLNGDGQLLFNNMFLDYPITGGTEVNRETRGWSYSGNLYGMLEGESDAPTYRIMQVGGSTVTTQYIYSKNIPVTAGTRVTIKGQVRANYDGITSTARVLSLRFFELSSNPAANAQSATKGGNSYCHVSTNATMTIGAGIGSDNATIQMTPMQANVWSDFTIDVLIPDGVSFLKLGNYNGNPDASTIHEFRRETVIAYQKGDKGVGISTTIVEYNKSTNSTTHPSSGWTSTIPSISGGQYLWTRVTLNYTDGKKSESYTVARQGEDGADGQLFTGETEPTDFNEGDIWYKVVSGKVTGVYEAKSGKWVAIPFESSVIAETIIGKTIQASHLTGSTIDGGKISGAEFLNEYENVTSGVNQVTDGKLGIKDGILQAGSTYYLTNSAGERLYKFATTEADIHQGTVNLRQRLYDDTGNQTSESTTSVRGGLITLSLSDASGNYNGVLDAKALTKSPWINLTLGSAFETKENNPCMYKIQHNLDGTRTVLFRGQFGLKSGDMVAGRDYYPFQVGSGTSADGETTLPAAIKPMKTEFAYGAIGVPSGPNPGGRLGITRTPKIVFSPGATATYCGISPLSYTIE